MRNFSTIRVLILAGLGLMMSAQALSQGISVGVSVNLAPPALPVYVQPAVPGPGYLWAPGYWAWGPEGYYWVPGTWVLAPQPGFLWTPGYWGFERGGYFWHGGYWGPHVGFYGGVNYGFGYVGVGYVGGYWNHGAFYYNRAVNNFGTTHITNVYNRTVVNNINVTRISYNGGGGIARQPTAVEMSAAREHHIAFAEGQMQHERAAASNRALLATVNHGAPSVAATPRPGQFSGRGIVGTKGAGVSRPPRDRNVGANHVNAGARPEVARPPAGYGMPSRNRATQAPLDRSGPPHNAPRQGGPGERDREAHPEH
jgi:hypothetical protein